MVGSHAAAMSRARKALRVLATAVLILAALWALAWLAVPPIVKNQAEQRLSALLGRPVTIGRVEFAPWSLALTIEQFTVGASGGRAAPQLEIARLYVNAELSSLWHLAPVVQALEVDAPHLRLARLGDGRYDIDDILARLKPADDAKASGDEPARFAVYNLRLSHGRVEFDDRPVQRQHQVESLQIALPFLSNLPSDVEVKVEPHLAFKLDGAAFDSGAQAQPFAKTRQANLKVTIANADLAPWLAYVPAGMPMRPARGVLASDLAIQFTQAADGTPRVSIAGQASLANAAFVAGASGDPALTWQRLAVGLKDVQPLVRRIGLSTVRLEGASVDLRRAADGRLNLVPADERAAARPSAAAASVPALAAPAGTGPWQVSIDKVEIAGARVDWHDATAQPAAALRVDALDAAAGPLRWPFEAGAGTPIRAQGRLAPVDAAASAATFTLQGSASYRAAQASATLDGLELRWLAPYLAGALVPSLEGRVQAQTNVQWASGDEPRLALDALGVRLEGLRVVERGAGTAATPVSVASASIADTKVDLLARKLALGSVKIEKPVLRLQRDRQGQINALAWLRRGDAAPAAAKVGATASAPWQVLVGDAQVSGGDVTWIDERPAPAATDDVHVRASALNVSVRGLAWPGDAKSVPARTQLSMRLADRDAATAAKAGAGSGRIDWSGSFTATPLTARGTLRTERVPLHALGPYLDSGLPVTLVRAEATWRGDVAFAMKGDSSKAIEASARGDAMVGDLRVYEREASARGDELLSWQSFALTGVQFRMAPGSRPSLTIGEAALTDFYSRLVITEDGRFNLRDVAATPRPADAAASAPVTSAASAASPSSSAAAASAPAADGLPIDVSVGGMRLVNGKVDFTDRFIKPNYSAALTELNGTLGAFSSASREMATLDLHGRAAGTALLEVAGSINPTARPLALDIRARATDLELAPLSPYAGRYAGYAIERGKLSMDVAYKIDAGGKLEASNQIVLNQLTFGDKVESPDATKLPVLLAVALLKDRNGVIDINLPISGSINDPQFSVFGIVMKIIGNLLVKALTAPFALLAGGGSEDLSFVGFEPGTASMSSAGRATLDKVAKALADRPALTMTVTGACDPQSERTAMQRAALEARIAAEQRRDALRAGAAPDAALPALTPEQRDVLVKRIYGDTKLPDKPRNVVGLAKDIPVPEMEGLLTKAVVVSTDSARELALQRGLVVRDALIAQGLPSERLFVAAPKLRASGEDEAAWSPRVQLVLSTR